MKTSAVALTAFAALFAGVWFLWPDDTHMPEYAPDGFELAAPRESDTPAAEPVATTGEVVGVTHESSRAPVEVAPSPADDDMMELTAHLDDELAALRSENDELRAQVAALQLAVLREQYPDDSPYGIFVHSYEAEQIKDSEERRQVKYALDEVEVWLRPGEATWLVERHRNNDWKQYGETRDVAMIRFYGPQRVLAEASPSQLKQYMEWYDEGEWLALFGTPKEED
jgi:hypothetical protein